VNDDRLELLRQNLSSLEQAAQRLRYSLDRCREIGMKSEYSLPELDAFEALTARFARLADMLVQKLFRLIDQIDLEDTGTVRDRIHRAEKKGLVASAAAFVEARLLRNVIAHEYHPDAVTALFRQVVDMTPVLLDTAERVKRRSQSYLL
jgi:hypothetical protein